MKCIVLIFTFILSFIFSEGREGKVCDSNHHCTYAAVECSASDATHENTDINDAATHPIKTGSFLADGNDLAVLFSSVNSSKRTQPSFKSSFRTINAVKGKVFDRNNLYIFQFLYLHFQYRLSSNNKYLYIICRLLI